MRCLFLASLALALQRALDIQPAHRVDTELRRRAAACWSGAEQEGLVIQ